MVNVIRGTCHYGYSNVVTTCCRLIPIFYSCTTLFDCSTPMLCLEDSCDKPTPIIIYKTFDMTVTSPTQPGFTTAGGTLTVDDNGDGTWHVWSDDAMTQVQFDTNKDVVTKVVVSDSKDLTICADMFAGCTSLVDIDLSGMDTSAVTDMSFMFEECPITTIDISNLDTSAATDIYAMFYDCSELTTIDVSNLDTSNVTNMSSMFYDCPKLTTLDLSTWTSTAPGNNAISMFYHCPALTNIQMFNTSNTDDFNGMFRNSANLICIDNIDTTNATDVANMFLTTPALIQPDATAQTNIAQTPGIAWTNANPCP